MKQRSTAGIGIICKTPQSGLSKTRLHPVLGPDACAELAAHFLRDVADVVAALNPALGTKAYAIYAPAGSEDAIRRLVPAEFGFMCRRDASLGQVMTSSTEALLGEGHDCVVLIGADFPTLPGAVIEQAIEALRRPGDRAVFGPAIDGGYYLVGLKRAHARLFEDIVWSTDSVLRTTLQRAEEIGLPVELLPTWYDVDDAETLAMLLDDLEHGLAPNGCWSGQRGSATATRAFLARYPDLRQDVQRRLGR